MLEMVIRSYSSISVTKTAVQLTFNLQSAYGLSSEPNHHL